MILTFIVVSLCYILLSFCTLPVAPAVECHVCNSHTQENCEKIIDNRYLTNCSEFKDGSETIGCRKMEQWLDTKILDHEPEHRIVRQCDTKSDESKDKGCIYRSGFGSRLLVCHCYEKLGGCNGASSLSLLSLFHVFGFMCMYLLL